MDELTDQEKKFFESGGKTEVVDEVEAEVTTEVTTETATAPPTQQTQVPAEKKKPSKFTYSEDTDNVADDLGRKYVPLNAVQEARNENKALKRQLEELSGKWAGGEKKLNELLSKIQPKDEGPSFAEKPIDHLKAKLDTLEQAEQQRAKDSEAHNQLNEVQRNILSAERSFSSKTPDYGDALGKVMEVWRSEYEIAGVPEQLIDSMLARKGLQFSHAAMQKDQNPGEAVYKLAQRYGYKKAEQPENKDKKKLETIAKGQEAEKSLAAGKAASEMSLEALAGMDDEEVDEFVSKHWNKLTKAAKKAA